MTSHYSVVRSGLGIYDISRKLDVTFDGLWAGHSKSKLYREEVGVFCP